MPERFTSTRSKIECGAFMPFMALSIVAFLAVVGLAIDGGQLYLTHKRLQNAADAGAYKGAYLLGRGMPKGNIDFRVKELIEQKLSLWGYSADQVDKMSFGVSFSGLSNVTVSIKEQPKTHILGSLPGFPDDYTVGVTATAGNSSVALMIGFDVSGSMRDCVLQGSGAPPCGSLQNPRKETAARGALLAFADLVLRHGDQIGIVKFGTNPEQVFPDPGSSPASIYWNSDLGAVHTMSPVITEDNKFQIGADLAHAINNNLNAYDRNTQFAHAQTNMPKAGRFIQQAMLSPADPSTSALGWDRRDPYRKGLVLFMTDGAPYVNDTSDVVAEINLSSQAACINSMGWTTTPLGNDRARAEYYMKGLMLRTAEVFDSLRDPAIAENRLVTHFLTFGQRDTGTAPTPYETFWNSDVTKSYLGCRAALDFNGLQNELPPHLRNLEFDCIPPSTSFQSAPSGVCGHAENGAQLLRLFLSTIPFFRPIMIS